MIKVADKEHWHKVWAFARQTNQTKSLSDQIKYLREYANRPGCTYDKTQGKDTCCTLYKDFAPHSFQFVMQKRESPTEDFKFWFNGGLIYSGPDQPLDGSFPALTVSIDKKYGWSVHT